jgi:hypothetical protein
MGFIGAYPTNLLFTRYLVQISMQMVYLCAIAIGLKNHIIRLLLRIHTALLACYCAIAGVGWLWAILKNQTKENVSH